MAQFQRRWQNKLNLESGGGIFVGIVLRVTHSNGKHGQDLVYVVKKAKLRSTFHSPTIASSKYSTYSISDSTCFTQSSLWLMSWCFVVTHRSI